jgi:hypothetical protein
MRHQPNHTEGGDKERERGRTEAEEKVKKENQGGRKEGGRGEERKRRGTL